MADKSAIDVLFAAICFGGILPRTAVGEFPPGFPKDLGAFPA